MGTKTKANLLADTRSYLGTGDGAGAGRFNDETLSLYADGEQLLLALDLPQGVLGSFVAGNSYGVEHITPTPNYRTLEKPKVGNEVSVLKTIALIYGSSERNVARLNDVVELYRKQSESRAMPFDTKTLFYAEYGRYYHVWPYTSEEFELLYVPVPTTLKGAATTTLISLPNTLYPLLVYRTAVTALMQIKEPWAQNAMSFVQGKINTVQQRLGLMSPTQEPVPLEISVPAAKR